MSILERRVENLEAKNISQIPKMDIFIIFVGVGESEPIGYRYNGMEVYRQSNETADELLNRLKMLVVDDESTGVDIFKVESC
jgi:hypothetical protein